MRRLFTAEEAAGRGLTREALRWGERSGRWRRIDRRVYAEGSDDPDAFDRARARVLATGGVASGRLAALLLRLDGVQEADRRPLRRRVLPEHRVAVIDGIRCADGLQTLVDLAADLDDLRWEQALESALRNRLTSIGDIKAALSGLGRTRTPGVRRIQRVLAARPDAAMPTESLLETLTVQLVRGSRACPSRPASTRSSTSMHRSSRASTSLGRSSDSSSSSMGSTTRGSRCTTLAGKPPLLPRPAGCLGASPGGRSSASRRQPPAALPPSPSRLAAGPSHGPAK